LGHRICTETEIVIKIATKYFKFIFN